MNVIEENTRLKKELANLKGKGPVMDPLPMQRPIVYPFPSQKSYKIKEGLDYISPKNKRTTSGVVIGDKTPRSDFVGNKNPHHILYVDYYGDVHAKYVGPIDGFVEYSIWVPKTLVTNLRGPIERWGPKPKQ